MIELTRRQMGIGAVSLLAASALPVSIDKILVTLDGGDIFEQIQAAKIRRIARLYKQFVQVDRDYAVDEHARAVWYRVHHALYMDTQLLRQYIEGDDNTQRAIRTWLDSLYPAPAIRAYHVPPPLEDLSREFAVRQFDLDAATLRVGEAEYRLYVWSRQNVRVPPITEAPLSFCREIEGLLIEQNTFAGSFAGLPVENPDDMIAMRRALMTYQDDFCVRRLNARRRWWLHRHA